VEEFHDGLYDLFKLLKGEEKKSEAPSSSIQTNEIAKTSKEDDQMSKMTAEVEDFIRTRVTAVKNTLLQKVDVPFLTYLVVRFRRIFPQFRRLQTQFACSRLVASNQLQGYNAQGSRYFPWKLEDPPGYQQAGQVPVSSPILRQPRR
jgi:hypothetical protein